MFLIVPQSDLHFGFEHSIFAHPIGRAGKIVGPKSRAPRKKFVNPSICSKIRSSGNLFSSQTTIKLKLKFSIHCIS